MDADSGGERRKPSITDPAEAPELAPELRMAYVRLLEGSDIRLRELDTGHRMLEKGEGPPVVLIHGTRDPSPLWTPLMNSCSGVRLLAPDRPQAQDREAAVAWLDGFLDAVGVSSATIVGHSAGGLWGLWYALARPERVDHLAMIGTPALPHTKVPLPFRVLATPGLGRLVVRGPATRKKAIQFATMVGEGETIRQHPALIDLLVAVGNNRPYVDVGLAEARQIVAPWALLRPSAFRPVADEVDLRGLRVPTTVIWGSRDPVGSVATAQHITDLIPEGDLQVFDAGHVPWFGHAPAIAELIGDIASQPGER